MMLSLFHELSDDLHILLLSHWLDIRSIVTLVIAVSSNTSIPYWKRLLRSLRAGAIDDVYHGASSLMWLIERGICVSRLQMKDDAWRVPGCYLSLLQTIDLVHLGLNGCTSVTDCCICNVVERCQGVSREHLSECDKLTDIGASALGHGCGKLQSIDLGGCRKVTDVGVSALGHGCGQLQYIYLRGCDKVTDIGISALGAGCGQLRRIDLTHFDKVTDVGVSALGHGCGQLHYVNLESCNKVTDAGISALSLGCGQLQSINLTCCDKVTDAGVSALESIYRRRGVSFSISRFA